jgi:hypothetical protein
VGLDWANKRGCGFMETSARNTVNIEKAFTLIVSIVVEARRLAESAGMVLREEEIWEIYECRVWLVIRC